MNPTHWLAASALCVLSACGGSDAPLAFLPLGNAANAQPTGVVPFQVTPVVMQVKDAPVPVKGADGLYHLVYELKLDNFNAVPATLTGIDAVHGSTGAVVQSLSPADIAQRLAVNDRHASPGTLGPAQGGLLYMHLSFSDAAAIPQTVAHRLRITLQGGASFDAVVARTTPSAPTALVLDAPLRGSRFIAGDGCCNSTRHVRATLPLDGRLFTSQRFAIDWEQLDEAWRIYVGDPKKVGSYHIYGQPIHAVASGKVVAALDGLRDEVPGALPVGLPPAHADGNHVVLDLGEGRYALFAHMQPGSVAVSVGQTVAVGQVLGRVGNSGNSSEPHLHFHVHDGPSPLASNGLPYLMRGFTALQRGVSTEAFDQAHHRRPPHPHRTRPCAGTRHGCDAHGSLDRRLPVLMPQAAGLATRGWHALRAQPGRPCTGARIREAHS